MGKHFSVSDLDQLLSDAVENTNKIQKELEEDQELIPQESPVSPQIANMVDKRSGGSTVDYSRVYGQLQRLIQNGNVALEVLAAIDPDVSGYQVASATASLMNAIKNAVAEFTKIHLQHIKFQQAIQLEEIKHQHRMEQLEKREAIIAARNKNNDSIDIEIATSPSGNKNGQVLIPYNTENVMDYMNYLKQQKQGKRP